MKKRYPGAVRGPYVAFAVLLGGCNSIFGMKSPQHTDAGADATGGDVAPQEAAPDAQTCFGSGKYTVCFTTLPTMPVQVGGGVNTDTAACSTDVHWVDSTQPPACFLVGTDITVAASTITGGQPLVLVATGSITFTGLVDLSSRRVGLNIIIGAGALATGCDTSAAAVENTNGGGGGAGGTLSTAGGNGGTGRPGATGAVAQAVMPYETLRGGCLGSIGAKGGGASPGAVGKGGGALYAVAGGTISLGTSTIAANGGGAAGSSTRWGGSGGGSGGMIVLYARAITANGATLVANGGGGGPGADGTGAGADPDPSMPTVPAAGGPSNNGGDGGTGYALGHPAGNGVDSTSATTGGGGGGGGGAGYIQTNVAITSDVIASPAITVVP